MKKLVQKLSRVRLPLVVAHDRSRVESIKVGGYIDPQTNVRFTTNASYEPFSPIRKLRTLDKAGTGTMVIAASDVGDLMPIGECEGCNSVLRSTAQFAKALKDSGTEHIHCVTCSEVVDMDIDDDVLEDKLAQEDAIMPPENDMGDDMDDMGDDDDALLDDDDDAGDVDAMGDGMDGMDDMSGMHGMDDESDMHDDMMPEGDDMLGDDDPEDMGDADDDMPSDMGDDDDNDASLVEEIKSALEAIAAVEDDMDDDSMADDDDDGIDDAQLDRDIEAILAEIEGEDGGDDMDADDMGGDDMGGGGDLADAGYEGGVTASADEDDEDDDDEDVVASMPFDDDGEEEKDEGIVADLGLAKLRVTRFSPKRLRDKHVTLAYVEGVDPFYHVFCGNLQVARLIKSKASSQIQSIFEKPTLVQSFLAVAKSEKGLSKQDQQNFGLRPINTVVALDAEVQKLTNQKIGEAKQELQKENDARDEEFEQAFATAALGIVKGVDAGQNNPIQDRLTETLSQLGIRQPERFIFAALAQSVEPFMRATMAKAKELMEKAPEAREEVARYVAQAKFVEPDPKDSEVTAKLLEGGRSIKVLSGDNPEGKRRDVETPGAQIGREVYKLLGG